MKTACVFGIIAAIAMIIFGIAFPVPEKRLDFSYYNEDWFGDGGTYVGGDAYNYQMEASLRAGWVSGVLSLKTFAICAGTVLFFVSIFEKAKYNAAQKQNLLLEEILRNLNEKETDEKVSVEPKFDRVDFPHS